MSNSDSQRAGGHARNTRAPLISAEKAAFVGRRFATTACGGLPLGTLLCNDDLADSAKWFAYVMPLLLFATLPVGIVTITVLHSQEVLNNIYLAMGVAAGYAILLAATLQLLAHRVRSSDPMHGINPGAASSARASLSDEQDLDIEDCWSTGFFDYLLPAGRSGKFYWHQQTLKISLLALLAAGAVDYLNINEVSRKFNADNSSALRLDALFLVAGYLTVAISAYPLIGSPCPELAVYRTAGAADFDGGIMRSCYALMPIAYHILITRVGITADHAFWSADASVLELADDLARVFFAVLPLQWALGLLPPLEGLVVWAAEQLVMIVFGGTAAANNFRLVRSLASSAAAAAGTALAYYFLESPTILIFFAIGLGFALSSNVIFTELQGVAEVKGRSRLSSARSGWADVIYRCFRLSASADRQLNRVHPGRVVGSMETPQGAASGAFDRADDDAFAAVVAGDQKQQFATASSSWTLFHTIIAASAIGCGIVLRALGYSNIQTDMTDARTAWADWIWDGMIFGVLTITRLAQHLQQPLWWRVVKNPLYPITHAIQGTTCSSVTARLLSTCTSLAMMTYLLTHSGAPETTALSVFEICYHTVFVSRAFRVVWQMPYDSVLDLAVTIILNHANIASSLDGRSKNFWLQIGFCGQLLVISFLLNRLRVLISTIHFAATLTVSAFVTPKLRPRKPVAVGITAVVLLPFHLLMILGAAVLNAPLIAVFGLPIFVMGFPRPARFWPSLEFVTGPVAADSESGFYKQIWPGLRMRLNELFHGPLSDARPGDVMMLRQEPYLVWLQLLERGNGYATVSCRGLELQRTSCHTAEASKLDELIEVAFPPPDRVDPSEDGLEDDASVEMAALQAPVPHKGDQAADIAALGVAKAGAVEASPNRHHNQKEHIVFLPDGEDGGGVPNGLHGVDSGSLSGEPHGSPHHGHAAPARVDDMAAQAEPGAAPDSDELWLPGQDKPLVAAQQKDHAVSAQQPQHGEVRVNIRSIQVQNAVTAAGKGRAARAQLAQQRRRLARAMSTSWCGIVAPGSELACMYEPVAAVDVSCYSITQNIVTGIIDDPSNIKLIAATFLKMLMLLLPASLVAPPARKGSMMSSREISDNLLDEPQLDVLFERFPFGFLAFLNSEPVDPYAFRKSLQYKLIMSVYGIVECCSQRGGVGTSSSPARVVNMFGGKVPPSLQDRLLTAASEPNRQLKELVLQAYRYAVKAVYDAAALGDAELLGEESDRGYRLLKQTALSYRHWHIGPEDVSPGHWAKLIAAGTPKLFSIAKDKQKSDKYISKTYEIQPQRFAVLRMNSASIKGLHASLNMELLYATNDDEERYSVQAHPLLLRNITLQAAEPPLGYAAYGAPLTDIVV